MHCAAAAESSPHIDIIRDGNGHGDDGGGGVIDNDGIL
jgi:hypothetical protein